MTLPKDLERAKVKSKQKPSPTPKVVRAYGFLDSKGKIIATSLPQRCFIFKAQYYPKGYVVKVEIKPLSRKRKV